MSRFARQHVAAIAFAGMTGPTTRRGRMRRHRPFALDEAGIADLQQRMNSGELTAHAIVQQYLDRIAAIDKAGPAINAIIELNPDALKIADELDAERKSGKVRGPLHGIPVLIKDNIDTADRMHTTAGSLALADSIAAQDSTVAANLRKAGAVILGKTNLSEWANFRSTHSTSGWSGRGGQTRNPYALDRNPCGSSSGTGAAIAANLAAAGIGSETDGSIVCPAATNGLVGIKPTLGLVSRAGIVPIAHSQDTAGPDGAHASPMRSRCSNAIAGADPRDALSASGECASQRLHALSRRQRLEGRAHRRRAQVRRIQSRRRRAAGAEHRSVEGSRRDRRRSGRAAESRQVRRRRTDRARVRIQARSRRLSWRPAFRIANAPRSLAELIAFNERERAREMPWFDQDLFEKSQARGPLTDKVYRDALAKEEVVAGKHGIDAALKKHKLDALIAPTGGPAWVTDWVNGDHTTGGSSTPAAVAGYPDITVPAGFVHGLPIGLELLCRRLERAEADRSCLCVRAGDACAPAAASSWQHRSRRSAHRRVQPRSRTTDAERGEQQRGDQARRLAAAAGAQSARRETRPEHSLPACRASFLRRPATSGW